MGLQSVQQASNQSRGNLKTQATAFDRSPALPGGLFEVRAGVPAHFALEQARCMADCIRKLSVRDDTLDGPSNYLVGFAADAIHALIESVEQ